MRWKTAAMSMEEWWPKLKPSTREWLIEHNGDAVPAEALAEIAEAGGSVATGPWWVGGNGPSGFYFFGPSCRLDRSGREC